jgi:hypothetical protein
MSATQTFSAGLNRLGFDAPTCKLLVDQGTIASICDLTNLSFPEIDKMIQHLSRWKRKVVDDDDDPVAGPTFPYLSVRKFMALHAWADYCILCNEVPNPANFHDHVVTHFLNRLTELEEVALAKKDGNEKKDPPKLASILGWLTWVELFHTFLAWHKSAIAGTPLSYIIRNKDEVTDKDCASEDCNLVDDDLVDTSVLSGVAFARDTSVSMICSSRWRWRDLVGHLFSPSTGSVMVALPLRH